MGVFSLLPVTVSCCRKSCPGSAVLRVCCRWPARSRSARTGRPADLAALRKGHAGLRRRLPRCMVMVLAAVFGVLIQGETVVALERIKPKPSKISPLSGLKRLFSVDSFVEFLKNVAKVLVIGAITALIARDVTASGNRPTRCPSVPALYPRCHPAPDDRDDRISGLVAVADILWKRAQWIKKQRMSMRELRDEHKDSEGDPHIKAKRGEIRRKRARQRISVAVPTATLVLTNPTHYAVALKYVPGVDQAPICVAKGTGLMAAQIRRIARDNDVAIVENRPLARTLHALVEVDSAIPVEHWRAVAEIIGYIMDLRRNIRRKPPTGSQLRDVD